MAYVRCFAFTSAKSVCASVHAQVASSTGKNKNSMLQDVLAGRPTEIDYLNGYVARWAEQQGRQAPLNKLICSLVRAKETMGKGLM